MPLFVDSRLVFAVYFSTRSISCHTSLTSGHRIYSKTVRKEKPQRRWMLVLGMDREKECLCWEKCGSLSVLVRKFCHHGGLKRMKCGFFFLCFSLIKQTVPVSGARQNQFQGESLRLKDAHWTCFNTCRNSLLLNNNLFLMFLQNSLVKNA